MKHIILAALVGVLVSGPVGAAEREYLRVTEATVNIRLAPNTSSDIVAKAKENDVFELSSEEGTEKGNWYSVLMFAGEWRYIHKSPAVEYVNGCRRLVSGNWRKGGC